MAHFLDANQLAEVCYELGLKDANAALVAACNVAGAALAAHLKIEMTVDGENAPGFGGLCVGFGPVKESDPCPESILNMDDCSDWHDATVAAAARMVAMNKKKARCK